MKAVLVDKAKELPVDTFANEARKWAAAACGDDTKASRRRNERRTASSWTADDGTKTAHVKFDDLGGEIFNREWDAIAEQLWRGQHGASTEGAPMVIGGKLRVDALVEMAKRSAGRSAGAGKARPTVVVSMTKEQLLDDLDQSRVKVRGGGSISAGEARRLACEADIIPAVLGGQSEVLDWGRKRRVASQSQRDALLEMYGGCVFDITHCRTEWVEIHHAARTWSTGGQTDLADLVPVCPRCHKAVDDGGWPLIRGPDGRWKPGPRPPGLPSYFH